jgi:uncharacterized protein YbjT (DUF2867 family)
MILVTGAAGNIGYEVVKALTQKGQKVRAVVIPETSKDGRFQPPGIAQALSFPEGVEVYQGDLSHPRTMIDAFKDVTGLFINPRAVGTAVTELLEVAKEQGVTRVVTLSASNVDEDPSRQHSRINGDRNKEVEESVMRSGMEWTALRSTFYAVNTVGFWANQIKAGDIVRGPSATWENTPVDEEDVAAVAVEAFLGDDLIGQRPIMSGPESLSQAEMVERIGKVIGRPLVYQEIPAEVAKQGMVQRGFSEAFADGFLSLSEQDAGKPSPVSDDIARILGRPAHTFEQWVARHASDFRA